MLPVTQREVLERAYYSDLSHGEIAEQLGVPLGTVKSRIRMGLITLRRLLAAAS
jgi:DNA-directed RNA polymerase specialized sigma24 family protein